jgi:hypothetical protein
MSSFGTTDFDGRVALGQVPNYEAWTKFGYNPDIDIGTTEVLAEFGGTFNPLLTAETMDIVSTSANDADAGTGAHGVVVYGVDGSYLPVIEVVMLTGLTPVTTVNSYLAINRVALFRAGSSQANEGRIEITGTSSATVQASLPIGGSTTQQCIFTTLDGATALFRTITINALKLSGGTAPVITVKGWVYSDVSKARYEVFRELVDTSVDNTVRFNLDVPFVIGERSTFWMEVETDQNNTAVQGRFSLIEYTP